MSEKRMLVVPAELVKKLDENRGDMSQADFINFLIDNQLKQVSKNEHYVTKDALGEFEQGIKDLMRNFLEFVVSYGLEMGKYPAKGDLEELSQRLKGVEKPLQVLEEEELSEIEQR